MLQGTKNEQSEQILIPGNHFSTRSVKSHHKVPQQDEKTQAGSLDLTVADFTVSA